MNEELKKINFDSNGLVPIIIQDDRTGSVLSLFYANKEALDRTEQTGFVWRYSRSKQRLMQKGEESGNIMKVVSISPDCDSDALLVRVIPKGPACHSGEISCFKNANSAGLLAELIRTIKNRKEKPSNESYTSSIVNNREKIIEKLREELQELIEAKRKKDIKWEAADLMYFLLVYLENQNLPFKEVLKELKRRRK